MRIIAGSLKSRTFEAPKGHATHPMSEKMRGALFNALGDINGLTILDAFSGSGAMSFEAYSRGALHSTAIEIDKLAYKIITTNAHDLSVDDHVRVIRANASSWSDNNPDKLFDIVIADPPYDDLQPKLLGKLFNHVRINGVYVLSIPHSFGFLPGHDMKLLSQKSYGDSQLVFYRRIA